MCPSLSARIAPSQPARRKSSTRPHARNLARAGERMPNPGPASWFFDAWSQVYDQPVVQWLMYRPVHDAVAAALREAPAARVLDVGCGTGLLTTRLRRELPDASVIGCDFSLGMLARADTGPRVAANALSLPFRSATFDAVVSTEAFHWFPDQPRALSEMLRVLRRGGRALVAVINTPGELARTFFHLMSRLGGVPFDWPTTEDMRVMFEQAGFRVEAQRRVSRLPADVLLPPVLTIGVRP